jgi:hypothetical protein
VSDQPGPDSLADRRNFIVILRLVAARGGRLLYGELVDIDAGPRGRFGNWLGLDSTIQRWLMDEMARTPAAGSDEQDLATADAGDLGAEGFGSTEPVEP